MYDFLARRTDEFELPCKEGFKCSGEVSGWKEICLGKLMSEKWCIFFTCESLLMQFSSLYQSSKYDQQFCPSHPLFGRGNLADPPDLPLHHRAKELMLKKLLTAGQVCA